MMNALIYDEKSNLFVRKPNGLQYDFNNVDRPALGFNFDVLVYDDIQVKIENWDDSKPFHEQEQVQLTDAEKDMVEIYIENSEPPIGHTLNGQYMNILRDKFDELSNEAVGIVGFNCPVDAMIAGREGSNHPHRSNARRYLEWYDSTANVVLDVSRIIDSTREDHLEDINSYLNQIPRFAPAPEQPRD